MPTTRREAEISRRRERLEAALARAMAVGDVKLTRYLQDQIRWCEVLKACA